MGAIIKKSLKDVIVLVCICAVFAVALAYTNSITAPIIEANLNAAANDAYLVVMPEASGFGAAIDLSTYDNLPSTVKEVVPEIKGLGYGIKLETTGYASGMILIVGVSSDGTVTGATCLTSSETNGAEKNYGDGFIGKDVEAAKAADLIAGSTMTTKAYRDAIVDAINTAAIMGGAVVDTRTPEQILADNLAAALPEGDEFTRLFITEIIEGVEKIYTAKNGAGYVCQIGEGEEAIFVGIGADGKAVAAVDAVTKPVENYDAQKTVAETAVAIMSASTSEEIDVTEYANSADREIKRVFRSVLSVKKTASGNYIIELKSTGYGSEPMKILVSLTADGVIIDNYTVSNSETANIGGAQLADGAYNSNFFGKNETEANGVDTVGGCTVTTEAYKKAILYAYSAVEILEGGAVNE